MVLVNEGEEFNLWRPADQGRTGQILRHVWIHEKNSKWTTTLIDSQPRK